MKTSSFFSPKLNENQYLVSIAGLTPEYIKSKFKIKKYFPLVPPKKLVLAYKEGMISEEEYTIEYNKILEKLDAKHTYEILKDAILLCWEPPGRFCHRRLVANWIKENVGIEVKEL